MPVPPRRPWVNRLLVFLIFALPLALFYVTQTISNRTRSGSVDEVWFVQTKSGPRVLARDRIVAGTQQSAKVIHRLAVIDARTGDRLARERTEEPLDLAGVAESGFWLRRKSDGGDAHLRDFGSLERIPAPANATPPSGVAPTFLPFGTEVTVGAVTHTNASLQTSGTFTEPQILEDANTGEPIVLKDPASFFVLHKPPEPGVLLISRVGEDGKPLWTARLERQRTLTRVAVLDDLLVAISAGAARDFGIGLGLADGKERWVHHF